MSELPGGWAVAKLGDVAESKLGKMLDRAKHTTGAQLPYLRNINVRWGAFELSDVFTMCFEDDELDRFALAPGDVIICEGGEPGRAAVWDGRVPGMKYQKALHRVRPTEALLPHWLVLHLRHAATSGRLDDLFTGTTIKHLTGASLAKLELTLPPAAEQKRIVAKIEELTARSRRAKEALDAVPPLLDKLRQSILAAAFRGDLTADWRAKNPNVEPADQLLARIRAERRARWEAAELGKLTAKGKRPTDDRWKAKYAEPSEPEASGEWPLPPGWAWAVVDDLAFAVDYGSSAKTNEDISGVPVLRMGNLFEGRLRLDDLKYLPRKHDEFPDLLLEEGDLLFNRTNSVELVGKTAVYEGTPSPCSFASYLIRLRLCGGYAPRLLSHFINSPFGRFWVNSVAAQQTGQANVNGTKLRALAVPVPPELEQAEVLRLLDVVLDGVRSAEARVELELENLGCLDQSILAKALRGELVAQDESDEPAAVLLERIRAARAARGSTKAGAGPSRRSRKGEEVAEEPDEGNEDGGSDVPAAPLDATPDRCATKDLGELDQDAVHDEIFAALWTRGPLKKDDAVRRVAEHLRDAGHVEFHRLRSDGPLYAQLLGFIEAAVKAGRLDRPKRGQVRACKADATMLTADDWRHALIASLGIEPTDREEAIRVAAEWARNNLGLAFTRLRSDGRIVQALRSAINSAIRRGEVIRHGATHIARAAQLRLIHEA